MFSQYSWWDFIKFVLVLVVPYYAYVIWKYYREDIREWISNRGQPAPVQSTNDDDPEEEASSSLFTVNTYDDDDDQPLMAHSSSNSKLAEWLPEVKTSTAPVAQKPMQEETIRTEVHLQGPAVADPSDASFSLPVLLQAENPQELSLDVFVSAAARIAPDKEGVLEAIVVDDEPATRIAQIINQQKESPLDTFAFNR